MKDLAEALRRSRRVAVLTGAGISAESGVPTFRGGGLWDKYRPEELATPQAFASDPLKVWQWYNWRRGLIAKAQPNEAHRILARWEKEGIFEDFLIITQNVDGLHQRAGSQRVIELHGNIWRLRCTSCGRVWTDLRESLPELPPRCQECGGLARPDVVWFGEPLPEQALERAFAAARSCQLFLVVGTSGVVQPAASLPFVAKESGAFVVEINPSTTPITSIADFYLQEKASQGMRKLNELLQDQGTS